ncbi:hypothetical protein PHYC_01708 [Phycisphaerales bacterium]|nr:hypothetical protein PHYC_01708 [Phycisphaerales bacterium]
MKTLSAVLLAAALLSLGACQSTPKSDTASASPGVLNTKCPMAGETPNPNVTADYKGGKVAFCCKGCMTKWNGKSDAEKAALLEKAK